jgi:hypothetical protein
LGNLIYRDNLFIKYSLSGIYGPYVKLGKDYHNKLPDWFKGPARPQDKAPPSILENLFSTSNQYKGKFLPMPSNLIGNQTKSSPGPIAYFNNSNSQVKSSHLIHEKNPLVGFLSSTERFSKTKNSISHLGPASYKPDACLRLCSKGKK